MLPDDPPKIPSNGHLWSRSFLQNLSTHVTTVCAYDWPEGLPPKFLSRGMSITQVKTPDSRETLSRGFNPYQHPTFISWTTEARVHFHTRIYMCHHPGRSTPLFIVYDAHPLRLSWAGLLDWSTIIYNSPDIERAPTNHISSFLITNIPGCTFLLQMDTF